MIPRIHVDDVVLAPLARGDAAAIFGAVDAHRDELARSLPWAAAACSIEAVQALVDAACDAGEQGAGSAWVIEVGGAAAGMVSLEGLDAEDGSASLGVWLVPPAQRRGIASRSVAAVIEHALGTLGRARVAYRCAADNDASRALARRLGLRRDAGADGGGEVAFGVTCSPRPSAFGPTARARARDID